MSKPAIKYDAQAGVLVAGICCLGYMMRIEAWGDNLEDCKVGIGKEIDTAIDSIQQLRAAVEAYEPGQGSGGGE
jgi:hypothetical protein